jgi:hypothetical protein
LVAYRRAATAPTIAALQGDAMKTCLRVLLAATMLLGACDTPPKSPEQRAADQCRLFRGYLSTQEPQYVIEACTRQMGEAACRDCLNR